MEQQPVIHSTFVIERNFPQPPARVFSAFADPALKRRWFGESKSQDVELFDLDFRVGGREQARYRFRDGSPFPGVALVNEGTYHDIVPGRRIVTAATMSLGEQRISTTLVTIELFANGTGTNLICTHQGAFYEGADGPEMREHGWKILFDHLGAELAR